MNKNIQFMSPAHFADVVLRLSHKISEFALCHEWQTARKLEEERNIVMQQLFAHPDINEALPSMTAIL